MTSKNRNKYIQYLTLTAILSVPIGLCAQFVAAKEYSKEVSLYRAKKFVIDKVLYQSSAVVKFEIDPLAAASSGELTSLVYQCDEKKQEGMILGFYGNYWNEAGVVYQGYMFKDLPKQKATALLEKIEKVIDEQSKYLNKDYQNNNVYFQEEEMTFLIYSAAFIKIRVFWKDFDAEWDMTSFKRTKRRLLKKLND